MKKDNKGFSLVELIVVVLIMGILAVALTPQVLKWVNNSRYANDKSLMGTVMTACQTALTNKAAYDQLPTGTNEITIEIKPSGTGNDATISGTTGSGTALSDKIAEYCGETSWDTFKSATHTQAKGSKIQIKINSKGKVTGTYTADGLSNYTSELGN